MMPQAHWSQNAIVLAVGAFGSVGLMLKAGQRSDERALIALMAVWVAAPFLALLVASMRSSHWSSRTRAALKVLVLLVTLGSLTAYVADALWPRSAQPAFMFVMVPGVSWLLMLIVLPAAALLSARRTGPVG